MRHPNSIPSQAHLPSLPHNIASMATQVQSQPCHSILLRCLRHSSAPPPTLSTPRPSFRPSLLGCDSGFLGPLLSVQDVPWHHHWEPVNPLLALSEAPRAPGRESLAVMVGDCLLLFALSSSLTLSLSLLPSPSLLFLSALPQLGLPSWSGHASYAEFSSQFPTGKDREKESSH